MIRWIQISVILLRHTKHEIAKEHFIDHNNSTFSPFFQDARDVKNITRTYRNKAREHVDARKLCLTAVLYSDCSRVRLLL